MQYEKIHTIHRALHGRRTARHGLHESGSQPARQPFGRNVVRRRSEDRNVAQHPAAPSVLAPGTLRIHRIGGHGHG